jgi:hypothetical protein
MKTAIAMIAIIAASLSGDAMAAQPTPAEIAAAHTKLLELYKTLPKTGPRTAAAATTAPAFVLGWNARTCADSFSVVSGNAELIGVINVDGSNIFAASSTSGEIAMQAELIAACQHQSYAVHIINVSTGAFDSIAIAYP